MKLSQMKNRVEETKLIEFFDNTVNAFIADPTSTDRVEFIAPRKQGESGMYRVKLNRLLEVNTSLEAGEMYKLMMEKDSRPFYYRPDYNQLTGLRKFSEQELADYKARKEAERAAEEAQPEVSTTINDDERPF